MPIKKVRGPRIRDKIAASKRKGIWVGGNLPLGYKMKDGKIAVVEKEAEQVGYIFRRYLELGSVNELVRDLGERNINTKFKKLSTGTTRGGITFGRGAPSRTFHRNSALSLLEIAIDSPS
jgi:site-specific DNA recombinase